MIARKVRKAMFKKLRDKVVANKVASGGITALIVGAVAAVFGIDMAPADVDIIVTAVASIAAALPVLGRLWRKIRGKDTPVTPAGE